MRKLIAVTLIFTGFFFAAIVPSRAQQQSAQQTSPAAEVTVNLKGVDGKTYDVAKMRGEVVIVSFGATWCQPCAAELEALEDLKREYRGKPVRFLWASVEEENRVSNAVLRHYAKSLRLSIPVLRDPEQIAYSQFSTRMRIPMLVFFDKAGKFVGPPHTGMSTPENYKERVRRTLDPLLDARAVDTAAGASSGAPR